MTAEIGLFNHSAIALAADSAMSLTNGKIYDSADKLFTLSKYAPVGIMVYSSASFQRFPWETIIKTYRSQLRDQTFPLISNYLTDFLDYLRSAKFLSTMVEEAEITAEAQAMASLAFRLARKSFFDRQRAGEKLELKEAIGEFNVLFDEASDKLRSLDFYEDFGPGDIGTVKLAYDAVFKEALKNALEDSLFGPIIPDLQEPFSAYMAERICRISDTQSGVVIAGFGDEEMLPSMEWFEIEGVVCGKLRLRRKESLNMDREGDPAHIRAFAQQEMVHRFVNGVDPELLEHFNEVFAAQIQSVTDTVADEVSKMAGVTKTAEEIKEAFVSANIVGNASAEFSSACENQITQEFWLPTVRMVEHLPKDELGNLAESLVSLTALKRKVSPDSNTVGGPIDVAIISKGDGFVWFRRKHYFKETLNPHFAANYFKR